MRVKKVSNTWNHQSETETRYSGTQELFDSEAGLASYNLELVRKIGDRLQIFESSETSRVLEYGAGTGTLAELFKSEYSLSPICVEIDPALIEHLKSKEFEVYSNLDLISGTLRYCYSSNVLEHIADDVDALESIYSKMESGGIFVIYVPALPIIFSDLDRNVGHYRRYTKKELTTKVRSVGFEVLDCEYNDCLGVLAGFILRIFGFKNRLRLGSQNSMRLYDKYVYSLSKKLDKLIFRKIIGKNILLTAKK